MLFLLSFDCSARCTGVKLSPCPESWKRRSAQPAASSRSQGQLPVTSAGFPSRLDAGSGIDSRLVLRAKLFAITGVLWCARSLASFTDPSFYDPESAWDWFAVVSFSAALAALAFALLSLARLVGGRIPMGAAVVAAAGAGIGAIGNLVEDGLQREWAGDWLYLPGVLLLGPGLVGLTVAVAVCARGMTRLLAGVPAATLIGLNLLGGVLVLGAWLAAAVIALRDENEVGPSMSTGEVA